jgi:hypothetical protein
MDNLEFGIEEIDVGSNFVDATISGNGGHEVEFKFFNMPKKLIIDTFKIYGIEIESEMSDYKY